eukprot:3099020-Amphidinium_carterae.1
MTKAHGGLRHGHPACRVGNCTFQEQFVGLRIRRQNKSDVPLPNAMLSQDHRVSPSPRDWDFKRAEGTSSAPHNTFVGHF